MQAFPTPPSVALAKHILLKKLCQAILSTPFKDCMFARARHRNMKAAYEGFARERVAVSRLQMQDARCWTQDSEWDFFLEGHH